MKLTLRVSAMVPAVIVCGTPQPLVLGHGHDQPTASVSRRCQLSQDVSIVVDVLQNVEGAHDVELVFERDLSRVDLHELCVYAATRHANGLVTDVSTDDVHLGKSGSDRFEYDTCATPQFEQIFDIREETPD